MEKEHELTEKLKKLETDIWNAKLDLKAINSKLENAYAYEDELVSRQNFAKKQTEELRKEFFQKSNEISSMYNDMKNIFDIYTGNYYSRIEIPNK